MNFDPWTYYATVTKIVDGDTIDVRVDLGFKISFEQRLRLARIDTWEVRGSEREQGLIAKARVEELTPVGSQVVIRTEKDKTGKYGRYIAEVYYLDGEEYGNLTDLLITEGHGEYKEY